MDFYDEGALIWLDADTLIREQTDGKKSLDDFCRAFFGGDDGPPEVKPYEPKDVYAALNGVVEHDWQGFFDERVSQAGAEPPLDGLTARRLEADLRPEAQRQSGVGRDAG